MTSMAAMPAQFQIGLRLSLEQGSPEIWEMEIWPGWTEESTERETESPRPSTAQPRKSKPGPRFATVAGAKVLTEEKTGSGSEMDNSRVLEGKERLQRKELTGLKVGVGLSTTGFTGVA